MCNFHLRTADTLGILSMLRATRDRVQLEEYIGPESVPHNPRNGNNFVFLLEKEIRKTNVNLLETEMINEDQSSKKPENFVRKSSRCI
jgi:hypothetical protein